MSHATKKGSSTLLSRPSSQSMAMMTAATQTLRMKRSKVISLRSIIIF